MNTRKTKENERDPKRSKEILRDSLGHGHTRELEKPDVYRDTGQKDAPSTAIQVGKGTPI